MRTIFFIALPAIAAAAYFALRPGNRAPTAEALPTSHYKRVCLQCHGASGEGNVELQTPSIAGQPAWYLKIQLEKFRNGWRGAEPRDTFGQQMRAIAITLTDEQIDDVITAVTTFPLRPTAATFGADTAAGKVIFEEQCMECHRYNGSGELVFGSSPLTAFQDWYIANQLEKFRLGIRGYDEQDEKGTQMRHLVGYLSAEDVKDVSAYIATLAERYPPRGR